MKEYRYKSMNTPDFLTMFMKSGHKFATSEKKLHGGNLYKTMAIICAIRLCTLSRSVTTADFPYNKAQPIPYGFLPQSVLV